MNNCLLTLAIKPVVTVSKSDICRIGKNYRTDTSLFYTENLKSQNGNWVLYALSQ